MVLSMDRWVGKVAVVTGVSSGIGAAIAEGLVAQGLKIAGLARRIDRMEALAQNISNKKGKLYPIKTDVSKEEDIIRAFKWIKENLGPIHILINNSGVLGETNLIDGETQLWKNTIDVNVLGLSICTREAIKNMRENNIDGHIIHINSIVGHQVYNIPNMNIYPASKFAVTALAETLRLELMRLKLKIKITSISPGAVDNGSFPEAIRKHCMEPENIVDAVIYALSTPAHVQVQELTVRTVDESFFSEHS